MRWAQHRVLGSPQRWAFGLYQFAVCDTDAPRENGAGDSLKTEAVMRSLANQVMKRQSTLWFDIVRPASIWVQSESLNLHSKERLVTAKQIHIATQMDTDGYKSCNDMCFEKIDRGQNAHVSMNHNKAHNCTPPCPSVFLICLLDCSFKTTDRIHPPTNAYHSCPRRSKAHFRKGCVISMLKMLYHVQVMRTMDI